MADDALGSAHQDRVDAIREELRAYRGRKKTEHRLSSVEHPELFRALRESDAFEATGKLQSIVGRFKEEDRYYAALFHALWATGDSVLARLQSAAEHLHVDQRTARTYSDRGLEALSVLLADRSQLLNMHAGRIHHILVMTVAEPGEDWDRVLTLLVRTASVAPIGRQILYVPSADGRTALVDGGEHLNVEDPTIAKIDWQEHGSGMYVRLARIEVNIDDLPFSDGQSELQYIFPGVELPTFFIEAPQTLKQEFFLTVSVIREGISIRLHRPSRIDLAQHLTETGWEMDRIRDILAHPTESSGPL